MHTKMGWAMLIKSKCLFMMGLMPLFIHRKTWKEKVQQPQFHSGAHQDIRITVPFQSRWDPLPNISPSIQLSHLTPLTPNLFKLTDCRSESDWPFHPNGSLDSALTSKSCAAGNVLKFYANLTWLWWDSKSFPGRPHVKLIYTWGFQKLKK